MAAPVGAYCWFAVRRTSYAVAEDGGVADGAAYAAPAYGAPCGGSSWVARSPTVDFPWDREHRPEERRQLGACN